MDPTVAEFHRKYYNSDVWKTMKWLGHPLLKCPLDLWIYQEIITELRPGLIIETGTYEGGSAMFMASICDLLGHGHVVTIDPTPSVTPEHPRITYLRGSSVDPTILAQVQQMVDHTDGPVVAILDAEHSKAYVVHELTHYSKFVTLGSYLICEDTNVNGRPVAVGFGPGPGEAVDEFLSVRPDYVRDPHRERLMMTFNPGGYLKRVS